MTDDLITGDNLVDREHSDLFRAVNLLLDACERGQTLASLKPVIRFLLAHTSEHFYHEEQLQEQSGYPRLELHRAFHETYKKSLRETLLQISPAGPTVTDVLNIHGQMAALIDHVKTEDRDMCRFLRER